MVAVVVFARLMICLQQMTHKALCSRFWNRLDSNFWVQKPLYLFFYIETSINLTIKKAALMRGNGLIAAEVGL